MCMTYVLALAFLAPVGLLMVIFWSWLPKRELIIGLVVLALSLGLYGWAVTQNLDQNSGKFFDFLDRAGGTEQVDESGQFLNLTDDAFKHAMRFVTGRDFVGQDVNANTTNPMTSSLFGNRLQKITTNSPTGARNAKANT